MPAGARIGDVEDHREAHFQLQWWHKIAATSDEEAVDEQEVAFRWWPSSRNLLHGDRPCRNNDVLVPRCAVAQCHGASFTQSCRRHKTTARIPNETCPGTSHVCLNKHVVRPEVSGENVLDLLRVVPCDDQIILRGDEPEVLFEPPILPNSADGLFQLELLKVLLRLLLRLLHSRLRMHDRARGLLPSFFPLGVQLGDVGMWRQVQVQRHHLHGSVILLLIRIIALALGRGEQK
mmetsp:Transcript_126401/g.404710  ORF Transcript_126401/g.404710 Transcript_126401/m.404710 type:complete len:234 (-) Transcript_126401:1565-2266(-)